MRATSRIRELQAPLPRDPVIGRYRLFLQRQGRRLLNYALPLASSHTSYLSIACHYAA
jgi:hypothetical protein